MLSNSVVAILILATIVVLQALANTHTVGFATQASTAQQKASANGDPSSDNWPTYHRDMFRSGYDPNIAQFSSVSLNWRSSTPLDGDIYAEPLVVGSTVIVATEQNSLYKLNATDGQIIWRTNFGAPVMQSDLDPTCQGDINPSGITSTPVIDLSSGTIFVVAFLKALNGTLYHQLNGVDLATGAVEFSRVIDPQSPNFTAKYQQQRAALALSNGYVYVAYGGLDGDCGPYHGWIVASKADGSGPLVSYQVPTEREGAIWGGGDGPVVDSSGNIWVATGNGANTSPPFDFGDSVIKLSPAASGLAVLDWFAPSTWATLNADDLDLGSTEPVILSSNYIFQIGKGGVGYILDETHLGQMNEGAFGGQLYSAQVCSGQGMAFGGLAYYSPYLIVPCDNGLVALEVSLGSSPSFTISWRGPTFTTGPPIIVGNAVWDVDIDSGTLYVFSLTSGQTLFQDNTIGSPPTHFNSLSAGDSQIFVTANREVSAYVPQQLGITVTPQTPLNGTASVAGFQTLVAKVTSSTSPVAGANVTLYVNGTVICTNQLSSSTGLVSCPFEITAAGTYYWNGTAEELGYQPANAPQITNNFTAGPVVSKIPLVAGWNMISIPIIPASTTIGTVLAAQVAGGNFTIIWSYQGGKWLSATLSGGKLSGTLITLQDGYGYWIYMTVADNLFIVGNDFALPPATPPSYALNVGWNLVGFTPEPLIGPEATSTYLGSLSGKYNRVYLYDNSSESWNENPASLQPGQAIWVYVTAPATLRP